MLYEGKNSIMKVKDIFKSKKNDRTSEYVGVFVGKDGSFAFDAISEKRYKGILTGSKIVAGFVVSQKPFGDCEAVNDNNADRLYVEGVVISPRISDVIYDVLHDFIVINCMERGAKWLSLKLDKNSGFAHYLASEDAYKLAGTTVEHIYFDVDVANFD